MRNIEIFKKLYWISILLFTFSCDRLVRYDGMDKLFADAVEEKLQSRGELSDDEVIQNLNEQDSRGDTLLTIAIERGNVDLVNRVVQFANTSDVDILQRVGANMDVPLVLAVKKVNVAIVEILVRAFVRASISLSEGIKERLVDEVIKLEDTTSQAEEISRAIKKLGLDIVKVSEIRERVKNIRRKAKRENRNIAILAMEDCKDEDDRQDILELLISGLSSEEINRTDKGVNALNYVVVEEKELELGILLSNINLDIDLVKTGLVLSIERNSKSMAEKLLKRYSYIGRSDADLKVEIEFLLKNRRIKMKMLELLYETVKLENHTNIKSVVERWKEEKGYILFNLWRDRDIDKLAILLSLSDVNAWKYQSMVLSEAVLEGNKDVVEMLLRYNENIEICQTTISTLAKRGDSDEMLKRLITYNGSMRRSGNGALLSALDLGNIKIVERLISVGVDVNIVDEEGSTLSMIASNYYDEEMLKMLLEKGASIEATDRKGNTLLMHAVVNGQKKIIELLFDRGVKIDSVNKEGQTALMMTAAIDEREEILEMLLNKGANIDIKAEDGHTALVYAAMCENEKTMELLFDRKANVDRKDLWAILTFAINRDKKEVLDMLLNHENVAIIDGDRYLALILAVYNNREEAIKRLDRTEGVDVDRLNRLKGVAEYLLEKSEITISELFTDIEVLEKKGRIVLKEAVREGNIVVVEELLKSLRVDPKEYGYELIVYAIESGQEKVVQKLIELGADIEASNREGNTLLMLAAKSGHVEVVRTLLAKGANIEATNKSRDRALMIAAESGHLEVVRVLLGNRAKVEATNKSKDRALMIASRSGHVEVVRALLDYGVKIEATNKSRDTALMIAAESGHVEVLIALLDYEAKFNYKERILENKNSDNRTALMLAAYSGHVGAVNALIDYGANFEERDRFGLTALMLAAYNNKAATLEVLIDRGANINAVNSERFTALMIASESGHVEVVKVLLAKNADTTLKQEDGFNALNIASRYGKQEIIKLLEKKESE